MGRESLLLCRPPIVRNSVLPGCRIAVNSAKGFCLCLPFVRKLAETAAFRVVSLCLGFFHLGSTAEPPRSDRKPPSRIRYDTLRVWFAPAPFATLRMSGAPSTSLNIAEGIDVPPPFGHFTEGHVHHSERRVHGGTAFLWMAEGVSCPRPTSSIVDTKGSTRVGTLHLAHDVAIPPPAYDSICDGPKSAYTSPLDLHMDLHPSLVTIDEEEHMINHKLSRVSLAAGWASDLRERAVPTPRSVRPPSRPSTPPGRR